MTGKKSAVPLAMRFLVCLALLAPFAGQAGADQISIYSWTGWRASTQVDYDDAVPWGGVSSLPAPETFTLPTQAYTGATLESVPAPNTPLNAGPGVTYYRALFDMPDFRDFAADLLISVDNDAEVYINRHLVAREGSLSEDNYRAPPLSVSLNWSGAVFNGNYGYQQFDWAASTFPRTNWVRGGVNEVIVVVRNLSGSDTGGFSFAMGITTYPNRPPVAIFDSAVRPSNTTIIGNVLGNDTDPDGDALTVTAVTQGAHGSVSFQPNGKITYTPNLNYRGRDIFTYTVSDGFATAIGNVQVDLLNQQPVANSNRVTADEDTPVTLQTTDLCTDPEGDPLRFVTISPGANGTVTIQATFDRLTYTPKPNFNGQDSFTYTTVDSFGAMVIGTATVMVSPVEDPPVAAADTAFVVFKGTATKNVVANDLDIDGDPLTVTAVTPPAFGTAAIVDNKVKYTNTDERLSAYRDSLIYTVSDGQGGSATAFLKLTISGRFPALSVPQPQPLTVKAGLPLSFTVKAQDPNYSPPVALPGLVQLSTLPKGSLFSRNNTLSWTPLFDQPGTYKVVFGARTSTSPSLLSTKAVAITVKPNRYPNLLVGGVPRQISVPVYNQVPVYKVSSQGVRYLIGYQKVLVGWEPRVASGQITGVELRKKNPTTTSILYQGFSGFGGMVAVFYLPGSTYRQNIGITRPAVGNLDGVGLSEVAVGGGTGSGGLVTVWWGSGRSKGVMAGWDAYNRANGETWPAVGNLNGTNYLLVGLGKGGLGYIRAFLWRSGEIVYGGELYLPDADNYNRTNGTTRPAIGDLTGDGKSEIVVGVDGYGSGRPTRVYIATLAAGVWRFAPLGIPAVAGLENAFYNCETWPAIGDLNGDGRKELVINVTKTVNGTRQPVGFGVWTTATVNGKLTFKLQAFKKAATFGLPALGDVVTPDGKAEIVFSDGPGKTTVSVFNTGIANGRWSIAPAAYIATGQNNPYPAFGEVVP
ncbi:MAG: tandem-95 repeat protein [Candidatus Latescibacteria bacterium]|nr:tandem-95 repeat protein [Candidatus Latescibacterota bacterium]